MPMVKFPAFDKKKKLKRVFRETNLKISFRFEKFREIFDFVSSYTKHFKISFRFVIISARYSAYRFVSYRHGKNPYRIPLSSRPSQFPQ